MTPLGKFQVAGVSGGKMLLDGGTMFGVVPKILWERRVPADARNRIDQDTNCVLVQNGAHNVLIDTGYGSKLTKKQQRIFSSEPGDPLQSSLNAVGIGYEDIGTVILSHLHFDHAGGATRYDDDGQLVPSFPNAEYVVQYREWVTATANLPELRGAYPQDNLLPLQEFDCLRFVDGDVEILPGIRALVTGGHTLAHQAVLIESDGATAVYLGDLCPTTHHLRQMWGMAYDVDPLQLRRKKTEVLGRIADHGHLALFDHDANRPAARLRRDDEHDFRLVEWQAVL